jgi:plastocyanin
MSTLKLIDPRSVLAIAVLAALSAAAPLSPNPGGVAAEAATVANGATVKIANFDFGPAAITVPVGASVTWINADDDAHSIVADNHAFRSKPLDTGESFSFTFTAPGIYSYRCGLHPQMIGKVVVTR